MTTYTNLSLSKKLHDLGIEVESEKWWSNINICLRGSVNYKKFNLVDNYEKWGKEDYACEKDLIKAYRAYSLSDLPAVLKAVGEVKEWGKYCNYCEGLGQVRVSVESDSCSALGEIVEDTCPRCNGKGIGDWQYHFLEIARIYATDPTKAFDYLLDLIKE